MNAIYVRMDDETKERLDKQAKQENRTRSNMIVTMIKDYLKREKITGLRRVDVALHQDKEGITDAT